METMLLCAMKCLYVAIKSNLTENDLRQVKVRYGIQLTIPAQKIRSALPDRLCLKP